MGEMNVMTGRENGYPSLLRPPRLASFSDEEYCTNFWPKLEGAILLILKQNPGEFIPISYEEMYSTVYKCVCQQYSERMHHSLIELVKSYLEQGARDLQNSPRPEYLEKFNYFMAQFLQAVAGIVAIFNYMNRFYVVPKLHTDLSVELKTLFTEIVANNELLFSLIEELHGKPFAVNPQTMMAIVKGLYSLKPEFSERNPALFAKYIPNILPPSQPQDLPSIIEQTQQMQQELIACHGFSRENTGRKRQADELQGDRLPCHQLQGSKD